MGRKKAAGVFITGFLVSMFLILPILNYFGMPSFDMLLTNLFGHNSPLALVFTLLLILLIIFGIFKRTKPIHRNDY